MKHEEAAITNDGVQALQRCAGCGAAIATHQGVNRDDRVWHLRCLENHLAIDALMPKEVPERPTVKVYEDELQILRSVERDYNRLLTENHELRTALRALAKEVR